jgi:outer membrane protein assembly factor BamB
MTSKAIFTRKRDWAVAIFSATFLVSFCAAFTAFRVYSAPSSDDWSMFRHDSAHTGATTSTGPPQPVKLWSYVEGHFDGSNIGSSAAVVNGVVYVGSNYNQVEQQGGNIYAFNASTGAKIWNYSTGGLIISSPNVMNGVVYIGSQDSNVYALNASTGAKIWNYYTNPSRLYGGGYFYGVQASPAVADGVVYVGTVDGKMYALNASTGRQIWEANAFLVLSSAAITDGVVYVAGHSYISALSTTTGSQIWNFTTQNVINSSSAIVNGVVYIGSQDGNFYAIGEPSSSTSLSDLQLIVVIGAVVVLILAVLFLVYRIRRKGAEVLPHAMSPPQP